MIPAPVTVKRTCGMATGHCSEGDLRLYTRAGQVEQRRKRPEAELTRVHLAEPLPRPLAPTGT